MYKNKKQIFTDESCLHDHNKSVLRISTRNGAIGMTLSLSQTEVYTFKPVVY